MWIVSQPPFKTPLTFLQDPIDDYQTRPRLRISTSLIWLSLPVLYTCYGQTLLLSADVQQVDMSLSQYVRPDQTRPYQTLPDPRLRISTFPLCTSALDLDDYKFLPAVFA